MNVSAPQVAVVVPAYNCGPLVHRTLASLAAQDLPGLEIVIVNDCSTDRTGEVLDAFCRAEPRARCLHLSANHGVHEARAAGLRETSAPWIGFCDADDHARPRMFSALHAIGESGGADIVVCGAALADAAGRRIGHKVRFRRSRTVATGIFEKFCQREFGSAVLWNKLYRRDLILRHGLRSFRWRQDATEDTLVNIGCFLDARKVCLTSEELYDYVIHDRSATRSADAARSFARLIRAYADAVDVYRTRGPEVLHRITELYARQLDDPAYHVRNAENLQEQETVISDPLRFLAGEYPSGLAALMNRGISRSGDRGRPKRTVRAILRLLQQLPSEVGAAVKRRRQDPMA